MKKNKKVVLAFSGGLDTSYCAIHLAKEKGYEVYTVAVNTGGFDEAEQKKLAQKDAILYLYLSFLAKDRDSNIYRKFGSSVADKIVFKARNLLKKYRSTRKFNNDLEDFDKYLKYFHYNPGTCADLTVTTLLISKIRDIFYFKI